MKIHKPKLAQGELFPLLQRAAEKWPGDVALVRGNSSLTFSRIKTAAEALASKLVAAGVKPGHKIGLLCPNGPEYVVGSFALFSIKGVVVPIFPGLTKSDVTELAVEMALDGYCYSPQYEAQIPDIGGKQVVATDAEDQLKFHIELAHQQMPLEAERKKFLKLGAPLIRFTSGTTSKSKGVIIPQSSMLEYTKRFARVYSIQKDDCILNLLSMAHIFYQVTTGMMQGAKLLVEEATDIDAIMRMIQQHRVTQVEATPTFYSMLLASKSASAATLSRVRYFTSCGAPLIDSVAEAFRERFGREIVQRYGLTETGPVLINVSEDASKRGSLGQPAPGCEIRLGNSSRDDRGEILVRCPGLFYGYYKPWNPNRSVIENGCFPT
ncbi:MAG TPA: long-chain fatty acid--CoA ligase, partial [Candidatus Binatia bacterium]